jgi:hypothetical protein
MVENVLDGIVKTFGSSGFPVKIRVSSTEIPEEPNL